MRDLVLLLFVIVPAWSQTEPSFEQLSKQGNDLIKTKDLPGAEKLFSDAAARAHSVGDGLWEAEFHRAVGETFERRSDYVNARANYQKSLAVRLAIEGTVPADRAQPNRKEIVRLYGGIGQQSFRLRDDKTAETYISKAIDGYSELGDKLQQAKLLTLLGLLQTNAGRLQDAEKSVKQALAVYETLANKQGTAECLGRLAEILQRSGDYRKALESGFRALDLQRGLDDQPKMADALEALGNIFLSMQQYDKALEYQRQCLDLRLKANEKLTDLRALAFTYNNIGILLKLTKDFDGSLSEYRKALEIRRRLQSPADVANSLNNMGAIHMALGKNAEARESLLEALAISEKQGYTVESGPTLYLLGIVAREQGDLAQSLRYLTRALAVREQSADSQGVVTTLIDIAKDLEIQGDLAGAEKHLERASKSWESLSREVSDPAQLGTFRKSARQLYPLYAEVVMKRGRPEDAFRIAERTRGAGLARMGRLGTSDFIDLLDPEDRKNWLSAAAQLGRAANRLRIAEQLPGRKGGRDAVDAGAAFLEADQELTRLRDRIFNTNPRLRPEDTEGGTSAAELESFARLHPDTLYAEWMMVDEKTTLLFAVSADKGLRAFALPTGDSALSGAVQAWYSALGKRKGRGILTKALAEDADAEPRLARDLYTQALGPVIPLLERGKYSRLVLVPDGALLRVPFGALLDGGGKRLIENYSISTNVSLRGAMRSVSPRPARLPLYAIGDPLASGEERLVVPFGFRFTPLEHAREEARSIGELFPGGKVVTGPAALEAEVKRDIGQAAILHFATHGILVADDGLRSGLLLATEPESSAEDGLLQAWEISGLALSARLAVLSACDTGQGDEQQGEGVMGLAWAFQGAGCPNIIASLWSVDDAATRELMLSFYSHLKLGEAIGEALREAMRETSRKPGYSSPYYWAAFQLIGPGGSIR